MIETKYSDYLNETATEKDFVDMHKGIIHKGRPLCRRGGVGGHGQKFLNKCVLYG